MAGKRELLIDGYNVIKSRFSFLPRTTPRSAPVAASARVRRQCDTQAPRSPQTDMSWSEVDLFFKRMRISALDLDAVDTVPGQVRAYLSQCSDDTLLNIAKQLGLDVKSQPAGEGLTALGGKQVLADRSFSGVHQPRAHVEAASRWPARGLAAVRHFGVRGA